MVYRGSVCGIYWSVADSAVAAPGSSAVTGGNEPSGSSGAGYNGTVPYVSGEYSVAGAKDVLVSGVECYV